MKYILLSNICLSVFYIIYLLIKNNESSFKQLRFYLLISILFSLLLPLSSYELNLGFFEKQQQEIPKPETNIQFVANTIAANAILDTTEEESLYDFLQNNWQQLLLWTYALLFFTLIGRIIFQIGIFFKYVAKAEKKKYSNYVLVYSNKTKTVFSFFKWIVVPVHLKDNKNTNNIIAHEKIHVSQYHSIDLIIVELLAAVMWFNPMVWMMRKSLQLIHEYQADEGALSTGIDRLKYQALLLNHVCEERIICLSSSFNHSLIKKRMLMISKSKFKRKTKLQILALIPLTVLLFLGVGIVNAQTNDELAATHIVSNNKSTPRQLLKIGEITWTGNTVFNETQLNDALGYKIGDKYDVGDFENYHFIAQNGTETLYKDRAYAFAQAEIKEIQINESTVQLDISIHEGLPVKVGEIFITGNKRVPEEDILEKIEIKSGNWFNKTKIIKSLEALKLIDQLLPEKINFRPIPVTSKTTKEYGVVDILFTVVEKGQDSPILKIGKITWKGNKAYSSSELNKKYRYKQGDVYNREELEKEKYANEVSDLYLDNGYMNFRFEIIEQPRIDNKEVDLTLKIYEGEKTKIGEISVIGNEKVPTEKILKEIDIKHGELYSRAKLSMAVKKLRLTNEFEKIVPNIMPVKNAPNDEYRMVDFQFTVVEKENNSTELKIGKITWEGNTIFSQGQLEKALGVKTGDNYDPENFKTQIWESPKGIASLYFENGNAFFNAVVKETSANKNSIDLKIIITEGVRCKFGKITITGNKKVAANEILTKLKIKSEDWFSRTNIVKSIEAIAAMNKFDPEKIIPISTPAKKKSNENYAIIDLEIQLTEL